MEVTDTMESDKRLVFTAGHYEGLISDDQRLMLQFRQPTLTDIHCCLHEVIPMTHNPAVSLLRTGNSRPDLAYMRQYEPTECLRMKRSNNLWHTDLRDLRLEYHHEPENIFSMDELKLNELVSILRPPNGKDVAMNEAGDSGACSGNP